ncbi:MAG: hypothetical protein R6X33_19525 [Candidatus Brocadiia bacterium]
MPAEIPSSEPSVIESEGRPGWVPRLFGSPVDKLLARAGCPVIEV